MRPESLDFLKRFLSCGTPSGHEDEGQKLWLSYVKDSVWESGHDVMGNVWGKSGQRLESRTVMVIGHCDEIGLMSSYVTDEGFIHFVPIGGVDTGILQGSRVRFIGTSTIGVVGRRPIHLREMEEAEEDDRELPAKRPKISDFWIDIGATDKDDALTKVPIGSVAYLCSDPIELHNGLISGRGLDDKVGAFVVAEVLRMSRESQGCVIGVSSVQEEIGLCGAKIVAERLKPDAAIVVDVGFATDTPDEDDAKRVGEVFLGKGPLVHLGPAVNRTLNQCLIESSTENVPIQQVPEPNETGTDADVIRLSNVGIPTALVSIPVRYMHTPVEVCSLADIEAAVFLIVGALDKIIKKASYSPF